MEITRLSILHRLKHSDASPGCLGTIVIALISPWVVFAAEEIGGNLVQTAVVAVFGSAANAWVVGMPVMSLAVFAALWLLTTTVLRLTGR